MKTHHWTLLKKTVPMVSIIILLSINASLLCVYCVASDQFIINKSYYDRSKQSTFEQPKIIYNRTFGGGSLDWGWAIQRTNDNGFIIGGETVSYGAGGYDAIMIKTDCMGNEEWNETFGGGQKDGCRSIQQTKDGGYILSGYADSYGYPGHDYWLIKTDEQGNEQWSKIFGGTGSDASYSVCQTSDEGFILTGYSYSYSNGGNDVWIVKTDMNGNEQWADNFGRNGNEYGMSIKETFDGDFIIVGSTDKHLQGDTDLWVLKIDENGTKIWDRIYGGTGNDWGGSITLRSDGGYIITGDTTSFGQGGFDVWLLNIDEDGNKLWDVTFGDEFHHETGYCVQQTQDDGFVITGSSTIIETSYSDLLIIKTDTNGNKEWISTVGGAYGDVGYSVVEAISGDIAVVGYTDSFGSGNRDIWLLVFGVYQPPEKPIVAGEMTGKIGETLSYNAVSSSQYHNLIYYLFDWGDGNKSEWVGPYSFGEICEMSHSWTELGNYEIVVKAKDGRGYESQWSDPISLKIQKNKIFDLNIVNIYKFFVKNTIYLIFIY